MPAPESTIAVWCHAETDKAMMVSLNSLYHATEHHRWLPKSKVTVEGSELSEGKTKITITAPDWLLRDRGLLAPLERKPDQ